MKRSGAAQEKLKANFAETGKLNKLQRPNRPTTFSAKNLCNPASGGTALLKIRKRLTANDSRHMAHGKGQRAKVNNVDG